MKSARCTIGAPSPQENPPSCCENPTCLTLTRHQNPTSSISVVPSAQCPVCKGSVNRASYRYFQAVANSVGVTRILIIGGGPDAHSDLVSLEREGTGLELRIIDGTRHVDSRRASRLMMWADIVVVWGSTLLKHSVSQAFNHPPSGTLKLRLAYGKRGIASLFRELCSLLAGKVASIALVGGGR